MVEGLRKLFNLGLLVLLTQMIYQQSKIFLENADVSSMLYKNFENHNEQSYPTFSVCIKQSRGTMFQESLGNLSVPYWNFISFGETDDKSNFTSIKFDMVKINITRMLQKYQRKSKDMNGKYKTQNWYDDFDSVFHITYQNPNRVCFSKKDLQEENRLIKHDLIILDYKFLPKKHSECHIYIHHKGQLVRSLTKPSIKLIGKSLMDGKLKGQKGFQYVIRMRSDAMEVLKKRIDANQPCNDNLKDDDSRWHQALIQKHQCIPTFMQRFASESYAHNLPECNPEQHFKVDTIYSPYDFFEAAGNLYQPPCSQMRSIVTKTEDLTRFEDKNVTKVILKFEYPLDYKIIINDRSFNAYDLWSQIGGIVGVIIGYSLAQIPETMERLAASLRYLSKPI